jgi:hypothetical protein
MKTAMKLTTNILAVAVLTAAAWAQNTDAIDQARSVAKSLQQKDANDSNAALDAAGTPAAGTPAAGTPAAGIPASSKPAPGAPAPAVKPAVIPGSQSNGSQAAVPSTTPTKAPAPAAKASAPAAKAVSVSAHNQLQKVNVAASADSIQIELSSSQDVTPKVSKLSSPARILVELPETVVATSSNKVAVNNGGVKGVRIGMDGKTPPTTSVVIDLEKATNYEVTPSSGGKLVLTLEADGGSHTAAPVVAKAVAPPAKPAVEPKAEAAKSATASKTAETKTAETKPAVAKVDSKPAAPAAKDSAKPATKEAVKVEAAANPKSPFAEPVKPAEPAKPKQEDKKWAMSGKRDPFFSPVVQQNGSGCSTGKKCLEIGNINLRGVVKSDTGFIAVVTNSLNKAYFLRENDPVFNGYVVKITGDSVVFSETVQDKLGKPFTREIVKRIFTPAV